MQNEAMHALFKNYSKENGMDIRFLGTGDGARYFADFLQTASYYVGDAPDMLLKKGNEAIIIEHFEFDSYSVSRKGSQGRQEMARIKRRESSREAIEDNALFSDEIKGESSFQNLITNLCRSFRKHCRHISQYKENLEGYGLIDDSTQVKTMFLVEDISPLGSMVLDNDQNSAPRPLIVLLCDAFLDVFRDSSDVDFVLACSSASSKDFMWFADRRDINEYYNHAVDYEKMTFLNFNVQVTGFRIVLPQDNVNDEQII